MNKTRKITLIGMFSAIAYIFTLLGHFVPISFTDFLRYDPKDAIIVMAGFSLGCLPALIVSVIVAFLELVTISATGIIGFAMNVIASATFACTAAFIYKRIKSIGGAGLGLLLSSVLTVCIMLLWNYFMTPIYMNVPKPVVEAMLLPVILPFNVIKCGLNSALAMLIYKPSITAMRSVGLMPKNKNGTNGVRISPLAIILSILLVVIMIILFIVLKG